MVIGICSVAITYITSAFFIFFLSEYIGGTLGLNADAFLIATFVMGIIWCGILGFMEEIAASIKVLLEQATHLKKMISRFAV